MASSNANVSAPVPFPHPESIQPSEQPSVDASTNTPVTPHRRSRASTNASTNTPVTPHRRSRASTNASTNSVTNRIRTASIKLMEADLPPGMWAATGTAASKAPTLSEIRKGSFSTEGWNEEHQRYKAERRGSQGGEEASRLPRRASCTQESPSRPRLGKAARTGSSGAREVLGTEPFPALTEEDMSAAPTRDSVPAKDAIQAPRYDMPEKEIGTASESRRSAETVQAEQTATMRSRHSRQFSNGYVPPPKIPWTTSTVIGLKAFWKWFLTIPGFLITIYCLNVVAWGGMIFLLLVKAAPAMCNPSCGDLQSPRRIWIEIDSQILTALFCVTGFGLAPWRFRDLYWWAVWRLGGSRRSATGIRRLAGIHRGWFRLPGSDSLPAEATAQTISAENPAVPIPADKIPDPPPTGIHAPPTKGWKMDFVVWMNVWNTFFQVVLCFYMWHYNRYNRPSWATGLFVTLACIVAAVAGLMMFQEGKYVKKVEGVPAPKGGHELV